MNIKYDIALTREERHDLFITALEGGINYWARRGAVKTSDERIEAVLYIDTDDAEDYEINPSFLDEDNVNLMRFSKVEVDDWIMQLGLDRLVKSPYQHHVIDVANDNADATTADVIVQMALFGDIVYG